MDAPFSFSGGGGFTVGSSHAPDAAPAAAAAANAPSAPAQPLATVIPACRPDAFPLNLLSPSLPPCPLLFAAPALHPLRGRVLVSTRAFQAGEVVLHEHAFLCSNWDEFRCAECDKPHATRSCAQAQRKWASKTLARMQRLEASLAAADCIGERDHARSFLKLLHMYLSESTLGAAAAGGSSLSDFFSLSYTHYDASLSGLTSKLPFQSSTMQEILVDAGAWPSGLSVEEAARMLAILSTNSHELSEIRGSGIFLRASLMEHSCEPNCNFSTSGRELQILALRPIAAGENLSIDYGMGMYKPVAARRANVLRSHGFTCFCSGCTSAPDRARAFTCPTVVDGQSCPGVVHPVGVDDREQEAQEWAKLVAEAAQAAQQQQQPSPLPTQQLSTDYPSPRHQSWSCTHCGQTLSAEQQKLALQREKEAAKKLRSYRDEEEEEDEAAPDGQSLDFDPAHSDEEDMDEEDEDEGDEIPPPHELIQSLSSLPAPALHPSHHSFFWALDFYARSASADSDFAADAIPIFEALLERVRSYIAPAPLHDQLMIYTDYLAQVLVVVGKVDAARQAFLQAWHLCAQLNGPSHHSSLDLKNLVDDTPTDGEELQMRYADFQQRLEALIYDTQKKEQQRKKKAAGKKKKGSGKLRTASSDDDSDSLDDDDASVAPASDVAVTRQNQVELLQKMYEHMQQMVLSKEKDAEGDQEMGEHKQNGANKKKKKKNKKKK